MPPARGRPPLPSPPAAPPSWAAGCVILILPRGLALSPERARSLADVVAKAGGETLQLLARAHDAAELARVTHVLAGAAYFEDAATALAAALRRAPAPALPLLSPDWVSQCAIARARLPIEARAFVAAFVARAHVCRAAQAYVLPPRAPRALSPAKATPTRCSPRRPPPPPETNGAGPDARVPSALELTLPTPCADALVAALRARAAQFATPGDALRRAAFAAAADALERVQFPVRTLRCLARLARPDAADADAASPTLPGWTGLRAGDAPYAALHAELSLPPPPPLLGLPAPRAARPEAALDAPPPPPLLRLPRELLRRVLSRLPPRALIRSALTCRALHAAVFAPPGLPTVAPLRLLSWNIKNNGVNRHTGQPSGAGCAVWEARRHTVAAALAAAAPSVVFLQEDSHDMLQSLFATSALCASPLACFPPALAPRVPIAPRGEAQAAGAAAAPPGAEVAWEQCALLYDASRLQLLEGGQFHWADGRHVLRLAAPEEAAAAGRQRVHMLPLTWALLRWRAAAADGDAGGDAPPCTFLALSAHFEAGHNWLHDVPAKQRSGRCVAAALARLRARFGPRIPIVMGGDFNQQKTQLSYRILVGDPAAGATPEEAPPPHTALIDAFDAWSHDCPSDGDGEGDWSSVKAPRGTVGNPGARRCRTGGVKGTTWHNWRGVPGCVATSNAMRDNQCQHRSAADGADGGARGHQRHIDAVLLCAGAAERGAARVRRARVACLRADCSSRRCALERLRQPGQAQDACECDGGGQWGSDHFPLVADVTLFFNV